MISQNKWHLKKKENPGTCELQYIKNKFEIIYLFIFVYIYILGRWFICFTTEDLFLEENKLVFKVTGVLKDTVNTLF